MKKDPSKFPLQVTPIGEVDKQGVDYVMVGREAGILRKLLDSNALTTFETRFIQNVWNMQKRLNNGRFHVRGLWPYVCLETEFMYPVSEETDTVFRLLAKTTGLSLDPMESPGPSLSHICLLYRRRVSEATKDGEYAAIAEDMARQRERLTMQTRVQWQSYGLTLM